MEATDGLGLEAEQAKLEELDKRFQSLDALQRVFIKLVSREEMKEAEGRRCILTLRGLKYHRKILYFQVQGGIVRQVEPYDSYHTLILAPMDSVLRVLNGILEGDEDIFSREWTRARARIMPGNLNGNYIHDGVVFAEGFRRLARLVRRYKKAMQSAGG